MIQFNENIHIAAPRPIDKRYLSERIGVYGGQLPYSACTEVNATIPINERYTGLTVNIGGSDYWYKTDILNTCLIEKKYTTTIPQEDYMTGGTNIGFFSGFTGVQTLPIDNLGDNNYDGNYDSLYNYFYRGVDGIIHIGAPDDGVYRRGYYKSTYPEKSWIWNEFTGSSNIRGWILIDGNISEQIGTYQDGVTYYNGSTSFPYTGSSFTTGIPYNNGSFLTINTVIGSYTTGNTLTVGGPVYSHTEDNLGVFRTLKSLTPVYLDVTYDEAFVYLSGTTAILNAENIGIGSEIFVQKTGSSLQFRTFKGSGDTTVSQVGDNVIIYSSSDGSAEAITGATTIGSGTTILTTTADRTLRLKGFIGSGSTTISTVDNNLIFYTSTSNECYNCASPAAVTVGGVSAGTALTGKTAFQLFEEILVPELCGTITAPSTSTVLGSFGLYEIGCNVAQTITGNFDRGCICPQYCSVSDKRSGLPNGYCFTGPSMPSGLQSCTALSAVQSIPSYSVTAGTQSWSVQTYYNAGSPALSSKGTEYCTALVAGSTSFCSGSIVGVYPLFGTTSNIELLTKQSLVDMTTGNNIEMQLVGETGTTKQKFEIPCAWINARPLAGVCTRNTIGNSWEYEGGTALTSLTYWTPSPSTENIKGIPIGYCMFTYNNTERRDSVCIILVF